jgi:hypothetical protein
LAAEVEGYSRRIGADKIGALNGKPRSHERNEIMSICFRCSPNTLACNIAERDDCHKDYLFERCGE